MTILSCLLLSLASMLSWGEQASSVDLVFAGDAMQHQAQIDAARRADGTYDYSQCFSEISPYIKGADYAVVNLETPLGALHIQAIHASAPPTNISMLYPRPDSI